MVFIGISTLGRVLLGAGGLVSVSVRFGLGGLQPGNRRMTMGKMKLYLDNIFLMAMVSVGRVTEIYP